MSGWKLFLREENKHEKRRDLARPIRNPQLHFVIL
jgi:hypothetical protein